MGRVISASPARRPYRSSRRSEQARLTQRGILDAATEVFLDRGFAGATLRAIAARAGVSVPTIEAQFGTKARVLKAAIDVAIAGDDEPVPVLDRDWTTEAAEAADLTEFLSVTAAVLGPAQARSWGLVLAVFEAARTDPELAELADRMTSQREGTAAWLVQGVVARARLVEGISQAEAVDIMWVLMDPAVFDRLTRRRGWTLGQYQTWFARSVRRELTGEPSPP